MCATLLYSCCFKPLLDKQQLSPHLSTHSYSTDGQLSHSVGFFNSTGLNYNLDDLRFNSQKDHEILSYTKMFRLPLGTIQPPIQCKLQIKQLAGTFENSPTASAEVKNEWSFPPTHTHTSMACTGTIQFIRSSLRSVKHQTQLLINKSHVVLLIHCCVCSPMSLSTHYSQSDV
jgi:hypothetical protein